MENFHKTLTECSETIINVKNGNANGQERLGEFEPRRNNALKRIVGNVNDSVTFSFQIAINTVTMALILQKPNNSIEKLKKIKN